MSDFIPSGQASPAPQLSQLEQDAKAGSGLAVASFVTSLALIFLSAGFLSFIGSILGHVVGAASSVDSSWWDDLMNEFDQNYNSY